MLTKMGIWWKTAVAGLVAATAVMLGCEPELEVRTFELQRLEGSEAAALISPYVYADREGAAGDMSHAEGVLTVREMPENLDRIAEVLATYDQAPAAVTLNFQLIEANGFSGGNDAFAEVEAELRSLLRYEGYRMVGDAVLQVREGGRATLQIDRIGDDGPTEEPPYQLEVWVAQISGDGGEAAADIAVSLNHPWYDNLLDTRVHVGNGKSMVLGTTSAGQGDAEAMILVVRPTVGHGS
jgi:hypothetical protein